MTIVPKTKTHTGRFYFFQVILLCLFMTLILNGAQEKKEKVLPKPADEKKDAAPSEVNEKELLPEPDPEPLVSYLIEAQLDPEARRVVATETMSWRNTTTHTVDHLRFHLYYNAFRNLKTTFFKDGTTFRMPQAQVKEMKFGEIKIKEVRRINGVDLTTNMSFVSPDDNNPEDRTVMNLKLEHPVEPGQSIRLKFEFRLTIPQVFSRTGTKDDFFFMGQWFPKIGVLQQDGQWNCHQFHKNSEFFADYGEYKVALTIPEKYVVGATGNLVKMEKNADETFTYFYEEKNIHDFAWTASPYFKKFTETVRLPGNSQDTTIELLLSQGHNKFKRRHLNSVKFALEFCSEHFITYPYNKITVVDPPLNALEAGGMEYPTLITTFSVGMLPYGVKLPEMVTIHEFGHQYWYGIVGSDEFREAWLDEGVNSFIEQEIMEQYFKDSPSFLDSWLITANGTDFQRLAYSLLLPVDPILRKSWEFMDGSQYSGNVYFKAAVLLRSLRNLIGKERMYDFIKFYTHKYKFKHPTSEDFIETFNSFLDADYTWAFDIFLKGEGKLDNAVYSIRSKKSEDKPGLYDNRVTFIRNQGYFPVELLITLENGKEIKYFWKEKEKWKKIQFNDNSPIKQAVIDPDYKVLLDIDYLNNSKVREADHSGIKRLAMKFGFIFQNVLSFFTL